MDMKVNKQNTHTERRNGMERRMHADQRNAIRFNNQGGDRRTGIGRRSTDESLEIID